ncbi:hypothetical protein GCM10023175_29860 [Pseudonocardia xishanensis]|uniref:DUF11 domain-containing protein n=1 Tax=Pseudonocardia xishanensis TaxID=630995 RepID=A0ABP8RU43_9PSEU
MATVTVTNKGTAAVAKASTAVTLDGGLLVVAAPGSAGPAAGRSVAFVDGPLAVGASVTHRVTVVGAEVGAAAVRATTGSAGPDATPADNTATAAVRIG